VSDRAEQAVAMFAQEFSCAQSVFAVFADSADVDRETALRLAAGFGGGLARTGETCGAVTGAVLALGLRHCGRPATDPQGKLAAYPAVREFLARFRALHGAVTCRELLGVDIYTEAGMERARGQDLFRCRCPGFVRDAARIVEELL
jgi:C_GCAxxG_C_C family probable redox protein